MLRRLLAAAVLIVPLLAQADMLSDGIAAYQKKDYMKASELLFPLAAKGSARAQLHLGYMYFHGQGVKEDNAKAAEWFGKAADQGNADAQYQMGYMYIFGFAGNDEPDPDLKGAEWYFKAALQGHVEAQYMLGQMLLAGTGVIASREEAARWFKKAADQGHEGAKESLEILRAHK